MDLHTPNVFSDYEQLRQIHSKRTTTTNTELLSRVKIAGRSPTRATLLEPYAEADLLELAHERASLRGDSYTV